eukprot:2617494-Karenia_brevis.AAC.1
MRLKTNGFAPSGGHWVNADIFCVALRVIHTLSARGANFAPPSGLIASRVFVRVRSKEWS